MKVQLLTKTPCPKCDQLKMYLQYGLADKYKEDIEVVHMQENPETFDELTEKHGVQATPVLVNGEHALHQCEPDKAEGFLRESLGY